MADVHRWDGCHARPSLDDFKDVLARWVDAEARGDVVALRDLLHDDFQGDGPRGFVLTKQQWLDRYATGDLVNHAFTWQDVELREFDDSAVAMGIQSQTATYRDDDCSGCYQGTMVAVRRDGRWRIVNVQLGRLPDPTPDVLPGAPGDVPDDPDDPDGAVGDLG